MQPHDLTGKAQADACAFLFGREERNEDLFLTLAADRKTVIGYTDYSLLRRSDLCGYPYALGFCLDSILDEIDQYLCYLAFVRIKDDVACFLLLGTCGT